MFCLGSIFLFNLFTSSLSAPFLEVTDVDWCWLILRKAESDTSRSETMSLGRSFFQLIQQILPKLESCHDIFVCLCSVKWLLERLCTTGRRKGTSFQLPGQTRPGLRSTARRRFPLLGSRSGKITCFSLFQGIVLFSLLIQNTSQYFWRHHDNSIIREGEFMTFQKIGFFLQNMKK